MTPPQVSSLGFSEYLSYSALDSQGTICTNFLMTVPTGMMGRFSMNGRNGNMTRVNLIVEQVTSLLRAGTYKKGDRLPSVRQAALEHGVSKNTMAEAYDRLVAEGLLEARVGSGYYVVYRDLAASNAPQPHIAEAADAVSLLREQLDQHYEVRPGDGRPPPSWMEASELRKHFEGFKVSGAG